jgi:impB/mucB/samB family C-terminal domain
LGIERLGQVAALPRGRPLHELAAGRDPRLLHLYVPKRVERAGRCFESAVNDRLVLEHAVGDIARTLAQWLEAATSAVTEVALILHLENGRLDEHTLHLRQPLASAESLRRVLCRALERTRLDGGVEAVEVVLENLTPNLPQQLSLFDYAAAQEQQVEQVAQRLMTRFGAGGFYRALSADRQALLRE